MTITSPIVAIGADLAGSGAAVAIAPFCARLVAYAAARLSGTPPPTLIGRGPRMASRVFSRLPPWIPGQAPEAASALCALSAIGLICWPGGDLLLGALLLFGGRIVLWGHDAPGSPRPVERFGRMRDIRAMVVAGILILVASGEARLGQASPAARILLAAGVLVARAVCTPGTPAPANRPTAEMLLDTGWALWLAGIVWPVGAVAPGAWPGVLAGIVATPVRAMFASAMIGAARGLWCGRMARHALAPAWLLGGVGLLLLAMQAGSR